MQAFPKLSGSGTSESLPLVTKYGPKDGIAIISSPPSHLQIALALRQSIGTVEVFADLSSEL
jgi:hypothetical protein